MTRLAAGILSLYVCLFAPAVFAGVYCEDISIAIASPGTVNDEMVITDHFAITDLNVKVVASHTWVGDLSFTLEKTAGDGSPIGPVTLMDRPGVPASVDGCSNDNVNLILDDEASNGPIENQCDSPLGANGPYTPDSPLSAFDGVDIAGTWRLNVSDAIEFDGGTWTQWCLITLSLLDIDGNGEVNVLEDGILILRHGFDFTGGLLTSGAVDTDNCTRCTAAEIENYIENLP